MLGDLWLEWQMLAAAALLLATAFAALAYMLGHLLNSDKMIAFGRMELAEVFYSAVLIILVLWILATATEAAGALIKGAYPGQLGNVICGPAFDNYFGGDTEHRFPCHMRAARYYLDTLYTEGKIFNYELLSTYMWYAFIAHIGINSDFHEHSSGSVQFTPLGSALSIPASVYSYMFEFGMKSMLIIRFQQFLLNFINYSIYPVFVVLGLLLRTFPFSRRLGGLLMAIGISLFFVFPMFYVLGGIIFQNIADNTAGHSPGPPYDPSMRKPEVITSLEFDPEEFYSKISIIEEDETLLPGADDIPGADADYFENSYITEVLYPESANYCQSTDTGFVEGTDLAADWLDQFFYAVDFTGLIFGTGLTNEDVSGLVEENYVSSLIGAGGVIDATARLVFFSMFFSLLSVFSTIGAIRSLSPLLGGDIELAGLTHLI